MMEILKFAVPAATGLMGLVKLLDKGNAVMRLLTTVLIIIGGAGSALLVHVSGQVEERRAVAAEQAQQRAEVKLDQMTGVLLGIQQDLAGLQVQLAKAPQGSTGSAGVTLNTALQKLAAAKQILQAIVPAAETKGTPAAKPGTGGK
jgi:hypothetical protein